MDLICKFDTFAFSGVKHILVVMMQFRMMFDLKIQTSNTGEVFFFFLNQLHSYRLCKNVLSCLQWIGAKSLNLNIWMIFLYVNLVRALFSSSRSETKLHPRSDHDSSREILLDATSQNVNIKYYWFFKAISWWLNM